MSAGKMARFGLLTALALILSYVDSLIPIGLPGVRLGLANTVLIFTVYMAHPMEAALLMLMKVLLSSLLFGFSQLPFSLAGGTLSLAVMYMTRSLRFSVVTVSVTGGVAHNAGQIIVAVMMTTTALLVTYLPVLMAAGIAAGLATGLAAKHTMRALIRYDKELRARAEGTDICPAGKQEKPINDHNT
jgi:heptaprenyl diphosphate synthase